MSFKGTNSRLSTEDIGKGIDGVSSISDIPEGYVLDAENVDLSEAGKVKRRAGYQTHACRLPVRTRRAEIAAGLGDKVFELDSVRNQEITISIFKNTGANLTNLSDSFFYHPDDSLNTVFVTVTWAAFSPGFTDVPPITVDTILQIVQGSVAVPVPYSYRPTIVFDDGTVSGVAKFLLPIQMLQGFNPVPVPTDLVGQDYTAYICDAFTFNRLPVEDIVSLSVGAAAPTVVTATFVAGSTLADLSLLTIVNFETVLRGADPARRTGVSGIVTAKTATTLSIQMYDSLSNPAGLVASLVNLSILYTEAKQFIYAAADSGRKFKTTGPILTGPGVQKIRILDCVRIVSNHSLTSTETGVAVATGNVDEIGFLFGTEIDVGYVNSLNKYFDADLGTERLVCGYRGSFFVETPMTGIFITADSPQYTGVATTFAASNGLFAIPIGSASSYYEENDIITIQYATDWLGTLVTKTYVVDSASATHVYLQAGTETRLYLPTLTYLKFRRTSSTVVWSVEPYFNFNGMTIQQGEANPLNPVYVVKQVSGSLPLFELDTEVTWESDSVFTPLNIFYPIFPEGMNAPITTAYPPSTVVDVNSVELERSVIFAARENGMWRYNGSQFVNMRIPRPPSGFIRNIRGTNGQLKIDTADDGLQSGRQYDFIVTYSYVELINGKLVTYESGLSPVGGYTITSAPALDGSGQSQLVELQVPTLPLGIGLPVESMFINVYRTKSGKLATQATSEIYLLERQVANNPYLPYVAILAGTEPPLDFNETNYKILYASVQSDVTSDELAREIIDPPLASVITALENRVIAANGGELPYVNLICKDVFDTSDGSFAADVQLRYSPPNATQDTSYEFVSVPLTPVTTTVTVSDDAGTNRVAQVFAPVGIYDLSTIAHTDNSHLFRLTGAAVLVGVKCLLRFEKGSKEASISGGKDPFYDSFGFESQTFTGTGGSTNTEVSAQKKWVSKDVSGTVITPSERFIIFQEYQSVENVSNENGLIITGSSGDSTSESEIAKFTLKIKTTAAVVFDVGDMLILKGLGTTGQVKDADGRILNFDTDIICEVLTAVTAADPDIYSLAICVISNSAAGATVYKRVVVKSALSVSNLAGGVFHGPFTIYAVDVGVKTTSFPITNTSLPSPTATLTITAAPVLTIPAGTDIIVDALPFDIPRGSNCNWNRHYKAVAPNYAAGAFTVTCPTLPEEVRGSIGQTLASDYGKLSIPKDIFAYGVAIGDVNYLQVLLTSQVLTVPVVAGDWIYMIVRGKENDTFYPPLSGWFKVVRVRNNVAAWVTSLAIGAALTGVEVEIDCPTASLPALDFAAMTGVSETKVVFIDQSTPSVALTKYIPVPVPLVQRNDPYLSDLTGTMYGPTDGYTPLEKVIKRFAHAINTVLHDKMFAYWGGRRIANDESSHPGNVLPTNGLKLLTHLYPVDEQFYRYVTTTHPTETREASWSLYGQAAYWHIDGETRSDGVATTYPRTAVTTVTAKETRPARLWYTNPTGTLIGQAFRELSFDEVDSQDGESIRAMCQQQTFGLLFKKSSSWRIQFDNGTYLTKDRIPAIVGASSAKNVIPTPKGAFVLHDSGVYFTDGASMEDVLQPSRVFRDRVAQNVDLFPFTAGFHNPFTKAVYIGVPLSEVRGPAVSTFDGQLVFDYSNRNITLYSIDVGWSVNTQIPATFWTRVGSESYFASTGGKVFRIRREHTKTVYSDERRSIPFLIRTRYVDATDPVGVRFYRSIFFQFGTETNNTMEVALTKDFGTTYTHISSFTVQTSDPLNAVATVALSDAYVDTMRRTPPTPRAQNLSIEITNDEVDTAAEVHGIFFESSDGTTKLTSQPGT
jgi:hypothetical protein